LEKEKASLEKKETPTCAALLVAANLVVEV